jgi:outer membrane lipoprotein-sorting protein
MNIRTIRTAHALPIVILHALVFVGVTAAQQTGPVGLLQQALKQYKGLTNYRAEALQIYDMPATKTSDQYHRTIRAAGEKIYAEEHEPLHRLTIIDGVNRWDYLPERLEYAQRPYEPSVEPVEISSLQRLAAANISDVRALPDETISLQGQWNTCSVIQATFDFAGGTRQATLWIDKSQQVIRKVVYSGKNGQTVTTVILSMDTTAQIPGSQFTFTPPANAVRLTVK